eukprot:9435453-Alexandrium_andersonii.AAC.1
MANRAATGSGVLGAPAAHGGEAGNRDGADPWLWIPAVSRQVLFGRDEHEMPADGPPRVPAPAVRSALAA